MKVLILGGAGFIGSNIVKHLLTFKKDLTIIDGLLPFTGGNEKNISDYLDKISFIHSKIEEVKNIGDLTAKSDLIIDCMAWTSHLKAIEEPLFDLKLNAASHLFLIKHLKENQNIIYLGSSAQYGNPPQLEITEKTEMRPEDLQGIHKQTAESYFRIYSKIKKFNVISLRIPNCFGVNQPFIGDDIGLVGGFIRDVFNKKKIEIYGHNRKKNLIYVEDLCEIISRLTYKKLSGFHAFNIGGDQIYIEELAKTIIAMVGQGDYEVKEMPSEIKNIDLGNARFVDDKLRKLLGVLPTTDFHYALQQLLKYYQYRVDESK